MSMSCQTRTTAAPVQVKQTATPSLQRACACGQHTHGEGECEACRNKHEGILQRSAVGHSPDTAPPIVQEVLRSPGQPLDTQTRAFMEPRFGHNFSQVRVHTDTKAAESARSVNALAYTVGQNVVFGAGQYALGTSAGQRLMAHELAHVVQQNGLVPSGVPLTVGHTVSAEEHNAETVANTITSAQPFLSNPTQNVYVARQDGGSQAAQANQPADQTPSFLQSTIRDFCQPFATRQEARAARQYAIQNFLPLDESLFGAEVGSLWRSYLNRKLGDSLARRIFLSPASQVVQGFVRSVTTNARQRNLVDLIKAALPGNCPNLPPSVPVDIPVNRLISPADLTFPINFSQKFEIPGHIAGGVSGSDAGPDTRQVSGAVTLQRDVDTTGKTTGIRVTTGFNFVVQDAVDFCPGGAGASDEQGLTILLSRLEATGLFLQDEPFAYDVPFEVRYSGNPIIEDLDIALVRRCFPDAVGSSQPPSNTPPSRPPNVPSDRPEERDGSR